MKTRAKYPLLLILTILSFAAQAQQPEMADGLRSEGKIYVVVAIILIILAGFIGYLILMDRKIKKLEDLLAEKTSQPK